jgi:hypothetical protein
MFIARKSDRRRRGYFGMIDSAAVIRRPTISAEGRGELLLALIAPAGVSS